jgi:hypothetical protein
MGEIFAILKEELICATLKMGNICYFENEGNM